MSYGGLHRRRGSAVSEKSVQSSSPSRSRAASPSPSLSITHPQPPATFDPKHLSRSDTPFQYGSADSGSSPPLYGHHGSLPLQKVPLPQLTALSRNRSGDSSTTLGPDSDAQLEIRVIMNRSDDANAYHERSKSNHATLQHPHPVLELEGHSRSALWRTPTPTEILTAQTTLTAAQIPLQSTKPQRLRSLDILRGITIIFMVLVNTQGADPFEQLAHSAWFGFTLADWVFPNFIFMVGMAVAIVLSPSKLATMSREDSAAAAAAATAAEMTTATHAIITTTMTAAFTSFWRRRQGRIRMTLKIIKRSLLLFGIGIALSAGELVDVPAESQWLRVPGVLQRISFCYLVLSMCVLWAPDPRNRGSSLLSNASNMVRAPFEDAAPPISTPSSSLHVQITLPLVCTALWFVLTYAVQSTATQPIPNCDYPVSAAPNSLGGPPSRGQLSPQSCTAQAFLDTVLFARGRDVNHPVFDSEGTLGSLTAVVTAWFGWMVGTAVMEQQRHQKLNDNRLLQKVQLSQAMEAKHLRDSDVETSGRLDAMSVECGNASVPIAVTGKNAQIRLDQQRRSLLLAYLGQWFMAGVCIMFSGIALGWVLPICKSLWTPSFTLYSAGISINVLCILMYIYDVVPSVSTSSVAVPHDSERAAQLSRGGLLLQYLERFLVSFGQACTYLLICYGRNPTLIYVLSEVVKLILDKIHVNAPLDWMQTAWSYIFFNSFITFMPPPWASLVFSLVYILVFAPIVWFLDRKGLYLRV